MNVSKEPPTGSSGPLRRLGRASPRRCDQADRAGKSFSGHRAQSVLDSLEVKLRVRVEVGGLESRSEETVE